MCNVKHTDEWFRNAPKPPPELLFFTKGESLGSRLLLRVLI